MAGYYARKLAAESLRQCYEIAPPRVQQYLEAEAEFIVNRLVGDAFVLDLGCGFGRTMSDFARAAALVVGVDTSPRSLRLAQELLRPLPNCLLARVDASRLSFKDGSFDVVVCIQNGLSAFHADRNKVVGEAVRVMRPGGTAYFSTYSDSFWEHRLQWFELQAAAGLIGPLDRERTRDGVIVCADGFEANTIRPAEFRALLTPFDVTLEVVEVGESSIFCVLAKPIA
ncbi:MAG: class I SAM-dependent methyltransferase [Acidimicrobiales bacterium]|jgi:2-polyprenyl-6-hydroxyphenyl methylase/3-demethylubiquinone-9 3-methyltransferase